MKKINWLLIIGGLFSAVGLALLVIKRDVLGAAIWLSFGNGLLLSDPRLLRRQQNGHGVPPLPKSRRYASYFLFGLAILLLVLQIYTDQKTQQGLSPARAAAEQETPN